MSGSWEQTNDDLERMQHAIIITLEIRAVKNQAIERNA